MRWETTSNFKSCFVISIQYFSHRFLTFPGHFCFALHCLVIVCRVPLSGKRISVCSTCTEKAVLCYDSFAFLLTIFKALHWHIECLAISSAVSAVYKHLGLFKIHCHIINWETFTYIQIIWYFLSPQISVQYSGKRATNWCCSSNMVTGLMSPNYLN